MTNTPSISPPSSVTSCSRDSEDIASKYHRLAAQYAQLRAQVVVLKRGLLDERERNTFIKNSDVGKAQKIRSLQQEVDGLTFRNKQLTKRIDSLQTELDGTPKKKGKAKNNGNYPDLSAKDIASIHFEELEAKIRENEMLHTKLTSIEDRYEYKIKELEEKQSQLEASKRDSDNIVKVSKEQYELSLSKEQRKSASLQVQVDKLQKKYDAANAAVQKSKVADGGYGSTSPDKRKQRVKNEDRLNVYAKDRKRSILIDHILEVMTGYISEYVSSLLNYCTYLEQRTQIHSAEVGEILTTTSQKLCDSLLENAKFIRPLTSAFTAFSEDVKSSNFNLSSCYKLKEFSEIHSEITQYLVEVFNLVKQSLSEESMLMSCSIQMENCNSALCDTIQPLSIALQNMNFSLSNIPLVADSSTAGKYIPVFIENVKELSTAVRNHLSATHPKLILCHKLPTVTQRLKTTDECCVASLQRYTNTLTKIARHLEDNVSILTKPSRFTSEQNSPYTDMLAKSCVSYMEHVLTEHPVYDGEADNELIPSRETLIPVSPTTDNTELAKAKEKISKLEQSKEHWMLEAQLLNIKLEKLHKQLHEVERNKMVEKSDNVPVDNLLDLSENDNTLKSASPWDDTGLREEAIRQHYTARIENLNEKLQDVEGGTLTYKRECINLRKRLIIAERHQNQAAIEITNSDNMKRQLEDELKLTKEKYESQIALMTEHICVMDEKLVVLNEENQQLKHDAGSKQGRKK